MGTSFPPKRLLIMGIESPLSPSPSLSVFLSLSLSLSLSLPVSLSLSLSLSLSAIGATEQGEFQELDAPQENKIQQRIQVR